MPTGLEAFKAAVADGARFLSDRVDELKSFDDIKLLSVTVDRLTTWSKPGLLCIGDAAHAMSPVGGVGINLAIQDAVATANLLAAKLKAGTLRDEDLESVRRRRLFPVKVIQGMQVAVHNRVLKPDGVGRRTHLDGALGLEVVGPPMRGCDDGRRSSWVSACGRSTCTRPTVPSVPSAATFAVCRSGYPTKDASRP